MNVFDCALKIQEEAKLYYQRLEAQSSRSEMKHLFSLLAASEEEHRNNLMKLKRSLAPGKAKLEELKGVACRFKPVLTAREFLEDAKDDPDCYQFSMREEEQEIQLFEELASRAKNEATRTCLRMLADEERRHLHVVENIYDFVEAPRTYLAWGEFSNLRDL